MITKHIEIEGEEYRVCKDGDLEKVVTYFGKSSDTKPVDGVNNADRFYEMDGGKVYMFDEDALTWVEQ